MDDTRELFNILAAMYEGISHKRLDYNKFMDIFSKLKIVRKHIPIKGLELIIVIDELMDLKEKDLLEQINDETMDLVKRLYFGQSIFNEFGNVPVSNIIKHLLTPYQKNTCKNVRETGRHMDDFEFIFSFLGTIVDKDNVWEQHIIKKYNSSLYELLIHYYKNHERLSKINNELLASAVLNMYSVFYFKQDEYENDYTFLDEFVDNAISNRSEFLEYCDQEGIKLYYLKAEDVNTTYAGIIKYIDESYKLRKKGK